MEKKQREQWIASVLVGGLACFIVWLLAGEQISRWFNDITGRTAAREAREREEEKVRGDLAISLAKKSDVLLRGGLLGTSSRMEFERRGIAANNENWIADSLSKTKGSINVIGWKARSAGDGNFLVSFEWKVDGRGRGYYLEVNPTAKLVRKVRGDRVLMEKYGLGDGP